MELFYCFQRLISGKPGEFPGGPVVRSRRFHCGGLGSIPGRGTKILQAVWYGQKQKQKQKTQEKL